MRIISSTLLILLSCFSFYTQDKKESSDIKSQFISDDGCGDTSRESQFYVNRKGKITKIISASEVVFEQTAADGNRENREYKVELVGIDCKKNNKDIILFLQKYVLNQNVEVTGNLPKESDKRFKGLVFVASGDEKIGWINENLLDKGLAQYKSFESANLIPFNKPCQLQKAEERAKTAKLGIWAK